MNQQKKKSKTVIKILFVVLAILVLALVGAIIYFSLTGDFFKEEGEETITCGCYYIDPQVVNDCGETKRAFKFNTAKGTLKDCSASCPLSDLSTNMLYSTTPQDSYKVCKTKIVPTTQCMAMEVTTANGLLVTGRIQPNESIKITAKFDSDQYTGHTFLINNVSTEPDTVDGNEITKTISEFGEESILQVSAQAVNSRGDTVTSLVCNRLLEITTTARAGVNELTLDPYIENNNTKIKSAIISAGGLEDINTIIKFTFEKETLNMIDGFEIEAERGRISITEKDLYNSENFSDSNSFSLLDKYEGNIEITAEIIQGSNSLGFATASVDLIQKIADETGKESQEPQEEKIPTEEIPDNTEVAESSFSVSKTTSATCVERVSPTNTTTFTITVSNNSQNADTIESIKDKLPLGFAYVSGSSKLNGNNIADSIFVTTNNIGNSQEIIWEPQSPWSITASGTLTISFEAAAGTYALSGENLNEVIITPSEIPNDPSTLRASASLTVAQNCDNPEEKSIPQTGIFDSTLGRIGVGIGIILLGAIIYNTHQGNQLAHVIVNSEAYRDVEMTSYRVFNPKRYFEERILERRERKR